MVRLSLGLFALAGLATASATHDSRSAAHSKMIKVRNQDAVEVAPVKRDGGNRFTYYAAGLGACGGTNTDADYIVALNSKQFGNGENCYKTITIWYNGKNTQATIVDECPGCPEGGLDLTPNLFSFFSDLSAGVLYGSWWFDDSNDSA